MKGDYANSRIYRIVCNVTGKQYYGSTTQSLAKRLGTHKGDFNRWRQGKRGFITSFEIIENGDYDIVLVEELPDVKNVEQLRARERYHIEANECVNKFIPGRTTKEYCEDNKEKRSAYWAEYSANNKDTIKAQQKEYRAANKDKQKVYNVNHHAANREKILARKAERIICEHCGAEVRRDRIARHQRTKKCLAVQNQN